MLKPLPVLLALFGVCAAALAQEASSGKAKSAAAPAAPAASKPAFVPTATPAPAAKPTAEAKPEAQTPGVMQRLFGSRPGKRTLFSTTLEPKIAAATPAPITPKAAKSTPAPVAKKRKPKAKPSAEEPDDAVAKTDKPKPVVEAAEPAAPATPAPGKKSRKGKAAPVVAAKDGTEPTAEVDPETKEKLRFDQAKAKAAADPDVVALKAKADGAVSDDEARSAQRAYNKALFSRMRKIDGSLDARIDQLEAAILKRLDEK